MKKLFSLSHVKKHITMGSMFVALLLCSCKTAYPQDQNETVNQAKENIIGIWISSEGGNTKWVFTDSKTKMYYKDNLDNTYTYKISRDSYRCGVDMSDRLDRYPNESILTLTDTQSNEKKCYLVQNISNDTLVLRPFGYASFLVFDKQQ